MLYIITHSKRSKAVKQMAHILKVPIFTKQHDIKLNIGDVVLNWGCSALPNVSLDKINQKIQAFKLLNPPSNVGIAVNKLETFFTLDEEGIRVPKFYTQKEQAKSLFKNYEFVYCRSLIKSTQGRGIVIANKPEDLVDAALYTAGIPCKREYRVHVFRNKTLSITAKVVKNNTKQEDINPLIRNHNNGYVFAVDAVKIPNHIVMSLSSLARETATILGLDFCAIDIVRDYENNLYVLEVNTAPGLVGRTLNIYLSSLFQFYINFNKSPISDNYKLNLNYI